MFSESRRILVVVCYDVIDDKRRQKVATLLEGMGERVQFSVFELYLTSTELGALRRQLEALISAMEDRVAIYPLCGKDTMERVSFGKAVATHAFSYEVF